MPPIFHAVLNRLLRLPQQSLILLVRGYRFLLKPWLGSACRFEPTCSAYAMEALQRHGALGGSALAGWRLLRCQPWCEGGCDAVPRQFPDPVAGLFTRLKLNDGPGPQPTTPDPAAADVRPPTRNLP
ncbi:MAG: membrane protein insertion efficiency factor YidD [Rubrivivax sp.]|nr:membrane protein insertion efficiency factor YidD [Rubrivivax sp.]